MSFDLLWLVLTELLVLLLTLVLLLQLAPASFAELLAEMGTGAEMMLREMVVVVVVILVVEVVLLVVADAFAVSMEGPEGSDLLLVLLDRRWTPTPLTPTAGDDDDDTNTEPLPPELLE